MRIDKRGTSTLRLTMIGLAMAFAAVPNALSAQDRVYIYSGGHYADALGRLEVFSDWHVRKVIFSYSTSEGQSPIYTSEDDLPECVVWSGAESLILISDRHKDGGRFLRVIGMDGVEKANVDLISKADSITRQFGWLGSSRKVFFSEEVAGDQKEMCHRAEGVFAYDLETGVKALISGNARRVLWAEPRKQLLLSAYCYDCDGIIEAYDPVTNSTVTTELRGMRFSLEPGYYQGTCTSDEGKEGLFSENNELYAPAMAILRNRRIWTWLPGNIAVLCAGFYRSDLPEAAKQDYLYSPVTNKLQRLPGCYVAQCRNPKYILIVTRPEGTLREFCLDDAETIEPKDLPYYEEPKETPAPPQPK